MDTTTLYLPTDLHSALRELSRRTGRAQGEVIRDALQTYIREHEARPLPRSIGIAESDLNGADSEDWYRANFRHE
ncbi:MAG: ribbon-helix-helix protein, CopG family [Chloroflexota bacterium]|nr:ribbon-helix-helix protein, CopG family [Chloroflexota bacterium]